MTPLVVAILIAIYLTGCRATSAFLRENRERIMAIGRSSVPDLSGGYAKFGWWIIYAFIVSCWPIVMLHEAIIRYWERTQ